MKFTYFTGPFLKLFNMFFEFTYPLGPSLLPITPLFEFCKVAWLWSPELLPVFLNIKFYWAADGVLELFN